MEQLDSDRGVQVRVRLAIPPINRWKNRVEELWSDLETVGVGHVVEAQLFALGADVGPASDLVAGRVAVVVGRVSRVRVAETGAAHLVLRRVPEGKHWPSSSSWKATKGHAPRPSLDLAKGDLGRAEPNQANWNWWEQT